MFLVSDEPREFAAKSPDSLSIWAGRGNLRLVPTC
jgi:hypothetical protein